jgi:hypothetical protein
MSEALGQLLEYGVVGVLAAVGFYLYLRERKVVAENTKHDKAQQVSETKAKVKITNTLEDLVETVKAVGVNSKTDMGVCQGRVEVLIGEVRALLHEIELDRAKEEGRREITDRFTLPPKGGGHEPR